jgi:hypothetical protein
MKSNKFQQFKKNRCVDSWQQMFFFASSSAQILTKNFIVQGKVETNKDED